MRGWENPPEDPGETVESVERLIDTIRDTLRAAQELPAAEREQRIGSHTPENLLRSVAEGVIDLRRNHRDNLHLAWCSDCRGQLYRLEREYFEELRADRKPVKFSISENVTATEILLVHTRQFHADLLRESGSVLLRIVCDQASDFESVRINETSLGLPAPKKLLDREVLEIPLGSVLHRDTEVEIGFDYCGAAWTKRVRFVA